MKFISIELKRNILSFIAKLPNKFGTHKYSVHRTNQETVANNAITICCDEFRLWPLIDAKQMSVCDGFYYILVDATDFITFVHVLLILHIITFLRLFIHFKSCFTLQHLHDIQNSSCYFPWHYNNCIYWNLYHIYLRMCRDDLMCKKIVHKK